MTYFPSIPSELLPLRTPHYRKPGDSEWTDERKELLQKLWNEDGLSGAECGERLGISRLAAQGQVYRMRRAGIPMVERKRDIMANAAERRARKTDLERESRHANGIMPRKKHSRPKAQTITRQKPVFSEQACEIAESSEFLAVHFDDLDAFIIGLMPALCRFPRGEGPTIRFCGQPTGSTGPYCQSCSRLAYQPPASRARSVGPVW